MESSPLSGLVRRWKPSSQKAVPPVALEGKECPFPVKGGAGVFQYPESTELGSRVGCPCSVCPVWGRLPPFKLRCAREAHTQQDSVSASPFWQ